MASHQCGTGLIPSMACEMVCGQLVRQMGFLSALQFLSIVKTAEMLQISVIAIH